MIGYHSRSRAESGSGRGVVSLVAIVLTLAASLLFNSQNVAQAVEAPAVGVSVQSDDLPSGHTASFTRDGLVEVGGPIGVDHAEAMLDGVRLDDRAMADKSRDPRTQFRIDAGPGRHVLKIRAVGPVISTPWREYAFSVSQPGKRQGRLVTPAGAPLVGAQVNFYNSAESGRQWLVLGTVTTDADGFWTLPKLRIGEHDRALAKNNSGVMNVEATAPSASGGFAAMTGFSVSISDAELLDAAVDSGAIQDMVVFGPVGTPAVGPSTLSQTPTVAGANRRSAVAFAGGFPRQVGDKDGCYYSGQGTKVLIDKQTKYSAVMEGHRSRDSFSSVDYDQTAGTTFSQGISLSRSGFSVSGSTYVGNSIGFSTGYSRRSYSRQWKVPIEYRKYEYWVCGLVNGNYQKVRFQSSLIQAYRYKVPKGGYVGVTGADVSGLDNWYGYKDAPYRAKLKRNTTFSLTQGKASKYSVSVSLWGYNFSSETSLSSSRKQSIAAGGKKQAHYIFGWKPIGPKMKVFYAY